MAAIELGSLSDHIADEELAELSAALKEHDAPSLPNEEGEHATIAKRIDDDVLDEFMDRLDGEEVAAELYLPVEFDGQIEVGDYRIASAPALLDALEALRDDFGIDESPKGEKDEDDEEEEEDDEDEPEGFSDIALVDKAMREMWRYFRDGAQAAVDRGLIMFVKHGK